MSLASTAPATASTNTRRLAAAIGAMRNTNDRNPPSPAARREYPTQDGFGWTNGVTLKLMALYPADADLGER